MNNNYLKFLLSISFCLNLFLGYYAIYSFFFKKTNNEFYQEIINEKENLIYNLEKENKKRDLKIDSLHKVNQDIIVKNNNIVLKINKNKKDEKIIRDNINDMDANALLRELSETEMGE
jgi:hypothetical protein